MRFIGREKEIRILEDAYSSRESEFIAVYGRRRVGKTLLVKHVLEDRFSFYYSGKLNIDRRTQLMSFRTALSDQGLDERNDFSNWFEAFSALKKLLNASPEDRKVVFLDEIAWMDNRESEFLPALEGFWNEWASGRDDILLIICASATSWIINKVFRNRGGLYNRLTGKIKLEQFSLKECEELAGEMNLGYTRLQVLSAYMILGGVAFYWTRLKKGLSVPQNIDNLFFSKDGFLKGEFRNLYYSIFNAPEGYIKIVSALGTRNIGLSKTQIAKETEISNNDRLGEMLEELEECDIIYSYLPLGKKNGTIYKLIDSLSLFHFQFLAGPDRPKSWISMMDSPEYLSWCGISYERVVLQHIEQVKRKLGINGMISYQYCWFSNNRKLLPGETGAQIDLLIDRADNIINIVEVKWTQDGRPYSMTAETEQNLLNKKRTLQSETKTKKGIHFTLVTISGFIPSCYTEIIQSDVRLDDLFA
jgi:uncharacterized protein